MGAGCLLPLIMRPSLHHQWLHWVARSLCWAPVFCGSHLRHTGVTCRILNPKACPKFQACIRPARQQGPLEKKTSHDRGLSLMIAKLCNIYDGNLRSSIGNSLRVHVPILWAECTYIRSTLRLKYILFGYVDP